MRNLETLAEALFVSRNGDGYDDPCNWEDARWFRELATALLDGSVSPDRIGDFEHITSEGDVWDNPLTSEEWVQIVSNEAWNCLH